MRRRAKASSAGSASRTASLRALWSMASVCAVAGVAFLAPSSAAAAGCPNEALREQQQATFLPDCRGYEQVSPAEKLGYHVGSNSDVAAVQLAVSATGDRITYTSAYPFPPNQAGSIGGYLGERGPGAWTTAGIPKVHGLNSFGIGQVSNGEVALRGSTPDGRVSVYWDSTTEPYGALWLRRADGSEVQIAAGKAFFPNFDGIGPQQPWFLGISADGRHVVFNTAARLGPAESLPPSSARILYEWVDDGSNAGAGSLRVVNRTDEAALTLLSTGNASLGGGVPIVTTRIPPRGSPNLYLHNAISPDGSRIFFQNPAPTAPTGGGGPLYMRENGAETIQISAPEPGYTPISPPTATGVKYLEAARDGSRVFFYANGDLTAGAPPSGGLYRYDVESERLTWFDEAPLGTETTGLADDDGSHFYYQRGPDVYLYDGQALTVVRANTTVNVSGSPRDSQLTPEAPGIRTDTCVSAGVTPDGQHFVFTAGISTGEIGVSAHPAVFRFDADSGELAKLISTSPEAPATSLGAQFSAYCTGVGNSGRLVDKRVISDDGRYVFFDTGDRLVPADGNGRIDAYRWRDDGDVALISAGRGPQNSSFQGADASGSSAFFTTMDPLVPQDGDEIYDLYVARVDGGYPFAEESTCAGDACQGPLSGPPASGAPGSSSFAGPGNASEGSPAQPKLRAARRKTFSGARGVLRIEVPGEGRLIVSGRGLRRVERVVKGARRYAIRVTLDRRARTALRNRNSFRTKARIAFKPRRGRSSQARVSLKFKTRSATRGH